MCAVPNEQHLKDFLKKPCPLHEGKAEECMDNYVEHFIGNNVYIKVNNLDTYIKGFKWIVDGEKFTEWLAESQMYDPTFILSQLKTSDFVEYTLQ